MLVILLPSHHHCEGRPPALMTVADLTKAQSLGYRAGTQKMIKFVLKFTVLARIIALDIGGKRTGIAVTDPLQMIATGLEGINTEQLVPYLKTYLEKENVETIVIGKPMQMNYTESESWEMILKVTEKLKQTFNDIKFEFYDERFTSKIALQSMKTAGAGKAEMKNKKTVDMVSATVLLQNYLENKKGL